MSAGAGEHTPEPWRIRVGPRDDQETCDIQICGDIFVLADLNGPQYPHQHPNAARIVACVNACAGIPTDQLEGFVDAILKLTDRAVSSVEDAVRESNWGDPTFGPDAGEALRMELDALLFKLGKHP